jgi:CBS domain-containing protein
MDTPVRHLLKQKGTFVLTTPPTASVFESIRRMVDHNLGAIVVTDGPSVAGIFTERDYLRRIVLQGRTSRTTAVSEVMTSNLVVASPDTTVETCLSLMTKARCRHLPVIEDDRLAGIVSIGDCVKHLLRAAETQVETLERYVRGRYPG